jgi:hypothetical protein
MCPDDDDNNNGEHEGEEEEDGNCNGKCMSSSSTNQNQNQKKKKKIIIKRTNNKNYFSFTFLFFFLSSYPAVLFVILSPRECHYIFVAALQQPKFPLIKKSTTTTAATTTIKTVRGLPIHRVPLRQQQQQQQQQSPYCYALSSITDLPSSSNFLATQVWPSARVAAKILEERFLIGDIFTTSSSSTSKIIRNDDDDESKSKSTKKKKFTICEFGCGPGLPSLTVAAAAAATSTSTTTTTTTTTTKVHVIATDVDEFALDLVNAAAIEQGLDSSMISTRIYDLINDNDSNENECWMDDVDIFIMSDVFESAAVAIGAARLTHRILYKQNTTTRSNNNNNNNNNRAKFFVFSQNDRAQRDVYIRELRNLILLQSKQEEEEAKVGGGDQRDNDELISSSSLPSLSSLVWSTPESYNPDDLLWLCEVDETQVNYG